MGKYYAVRRGRTTGIFTAWDECKKNVTGYSGAEYKSFTSREDAQRFINEGKSEQRTAATVQDIPAGEAVAYVDGSYNIRTKIFAFGAVIFHDGTIHKSSEAFDDASLASMRNVAGEIKGAMYAMSYCIEHGIKALTIYYDYEGIEKWCSGAWKTNKEGTTAYKKFYDEASMKLDISFVKVRGHSGDKYNDMADELAKKAAGIL